MEAKKGAASRPNKARFARHKVLFFVLKIGYKVFPHDQFWV